MTLPPDPDNSIITIDTIVFSVFKKLYHQFSFKTVGGFLVVNLTFLDQFGLTMIRIKKKAIFYLLTKFIILIQIPMEIKPIMKVTIRSISRIFRFEIDI